MTDLYLIAHRAHDTASFDVAERLACPECSKQIPDLEFPEVKYTAIKVDGCDECDGLGYWWIGATSGWRMYPWWWIDFDELAKGFIWEEVVKMMPPHARSLFNASATPPKPSGPSSLLAALGLGKKAEPIKRRV